MNNLVDYIFLLVIRFLQVLQGISLILFSIKYLFGIQTINISVTQSLLVTTGIFILLFNLSVKNMKFIDKLPILILIFLFKMQGILQIMYGINLFFPQLIMYNILRSGFILTLGLALFLI